jgi:hypothetical protein
MDLSHLAKNEPINIEEMRRRLRNMTDEELTKHGKDCAFLCSS